jgi:hypothetical protein
MKAGRLYHIVSQRIQTVKVHCKKVGGQVLHFAATHFQQPRMSGKAVF